MPKVIIEQASVVQLCPHFGPHGRVHETWLSRDGFMGVCQMAPSHLNNAIRMLLKSMRAISSIYAYERNDGRDIYDPDYQVTEEKLEILTRERRRREMVGKGWASSLKALEAPKREIIQGDCYDLECQNGCQGNCLVKVLQEPLDFGDSE